MGHLAHSDNVRASTVEAAVPSMIERAIEAALAPIRAELAEKHHRIDEYGLSLASLTSRVEDCEKDKGDSEKLTVVKDDIAVLKKEMDTLKSTYVFILWEDYDMHEPYHESTPSVPLVQPVHSLLREDSEDKRIEIHSSDDEDREAHEWSVDDTYKSLLL